MRIAKIQLNQQHFELHPYRAVYWVEEDTVLIADLKVVEKEPNKKLSSVSIQAIEKKYSRLYELTAYFHPRTVCFLGEAACQDHNYEWVRLQIFRKKFPDTEMVVINDSQISIEKLNGISVLQNLLIEPFFISHKPILTFNGTVNICGYSNPGFKVNSKNAAFRKRACFLSSPNRLTLPAFDTCASSNFITPAEHDTVYTILEQKVRKYRKV